MQEHIHTGDPMQYGMLASIYFALLRITQNKPLVESTAYVSMDDGSNPSAHLPTRPNKQELLKKMKRQKYDSKSQFRSVF